MIKDIRHTEEFKVRAHDVDAQQRLTIVGLLKLMQEASMTNAAQLNISVAELNQNNQAWVLLRKQVNINRYPEIEERLTVKTYPSGFDKLFAYRDYKVYDSKGQVVATASSTWTLLDKVQRKMSRIPESLYDLKPPAEETILDLPPKRLPKMEDICCKDEYRVRYFDLDWNYHMNNIHYVRLFLEQLPMEYLSQHVMTQVNYQIRAEAKIDELLTIEMSPIKDDEYTHRILTEDRKIVAIGHSLWQPR